MSPVSGQPDFGGKLVTDRSTAVVDQGEVAERINGVVGSFYRSGHWILADGFESGAIGAHYITAGILPILDSTRAYNGVNSAKFVTAAVNGSLSDLSRDLVIYPSRMGFECVFIAASLNNQSVRFSMVWNRSSDLYPNSLAATVLLNFDNAGAISMQLYEDNGGTGAYVTEVTPVLIKNVVPSLFHSIKFIMDFNTGSYGKLFLDYLQYDFSSKLMGKIAAAAAGHGLWLSFNARITANEAVIKTMNVDDLIISADEP